MPRQSDQESQKPLVGNRDASAKPRQPGLYYCEQIERIECVWAGELARKAGSDGDGADFHADGKNRYIEPEALWATVCVFVGWEWRDTRNTLGDEPSVSAS